MPVFYEAEKCNVAQECEENGLNAQPPAKHRAKQIKRQVEQQREHQ